MQPRHRPPTGTRVRLKPRASGSGFRSVRGLMTRAAFFRLLTQRTAETAEAVDRRIEARSLCELVVMVCDSSGFTRSTHQYGILQFLATMTRCYDHLIPILEKHRGICLSHNADNILAIFEKPCDAVQAAIQMNRWLQRHNKGRDDAEQFHICIGIHRGALLRLKDDVFGATVNVASKVGEDLAGRDEILLTGGVAESVRHRTECSYLRTAEIGGRTFELYQVRY